MHVCLDRFISFVGALLLITGWLALGCESAQEENPGQNTPSDGDADGDSDGDADGDTDGDSDGDTDVPPDTDGDGLSDDYEEELGTDPDDEDSDDDGVSDMVEVVAGTDPNDPESNPSAEGNFYFLEPFGQPPVPEMDTLVFETNIRALDVFVLMDTTASMGGEVQHLQESLSSTIIPEIDELITDVQFGVGHFDDFPVSPYGDSYTGDLVFSLDQAITDDPALAQAAANSLFTHGGSDIPESTVPALWAIATGNGLSSYLEDATCPTGTFGYPCFREGAIPVVMLIGDAPFHNGPSGGYPYDSSSLGFTPPTYDETVEELNAAHVKILSIVAEGSMYPAAAMADGTAISTDTNAVDLDDNPLVFGIDSEGEALEEEVINAVYALSEDVPISVTAVARDDMSDEQDATVFIDKIVPNTEGGVEDPENPGTFCVAGLLTADTDSDPEADEFSSVLPGTSVCFDIYAKQNDTVPATPDPQVFKAFIEVVGDSITVLDTREVYFLIPPNAPIIE